MEEDKKMDILKTADGSTTVYNHHLDEIYHSRHGAIQESQHVFIKMGLEYLISRKDKLSILEVGMGTGLNVFLSFLENLKCKRKIHFVAVEAYPLSEDILSKLNYAEQLGIADEDFVFKKIHSSTSGIELDLGNEFTLKVEYLKIEDFKSPKKFDLVYFDAFSPNVQPDMWTKEVFKNLYSLMSDNSILVTYCAKGVVRRTMQSAGFQVDRVEGPPGKREMLRAHKGSK